jgi:hypothetical protein
MIHHLQNGYFSDHGEAILRHVMFYLKLNCGVIRYLIEARFFDSHVVMSHISLGILKLSIFTQLNVINPNCQLLRSSWMMKFITGCIS